MPLATLRGNGIMKESDPIDSEAFRTTDARLIFLSWTS